MVMISVRLFHDMKVTVRDLWCDPIVAPCSSGQVSAKGMHG
jgi:hypothetical protein